MLFGTCIVRANTEPVVEKSQLLQMQKEIERSEYFISRKNNVGIYQSPNRKNGLSAAYTADEMSITPQDKQQHWSFSLTIKGVSADGRTVYKPVDQPLVNMYENAIQFNHNNQFTVEYVNNEQGIRQNFIIQQPGTHIQELTVKLQPENGWQASKRSATSLSFKNKQQLLSYDGLKVWDANGKSLPAHFLVQNNQVQIQVDVKNAIYPVTIDPIIANGTPLNSNGFIPGNTANIQLGYAVSKGGDLNNDGFEDVIVGAPGYKLNEGGVFAFYGSALGLNPRTYTVLEKHVADGKFGMFLSGGGDVNGDGFDDVVVGTPFNSGDFGYDQGAIYVFYGSAAGVQATPDIVDETQTNGYFGISVAIAKDLNGDAYDDILVGSDKTNTVTVFYGGPWGILYTPVTEIHTPATSSVFGVKVSGAGDVNNDGYNDMMVADGDYVYVYHGGPNGVNNPPAAVLGDQQNSYFGLAMAGGGDINGDNYDDIVIGARSYTDYSNVSNMHPEAGAIYIFYGSSGGINPSTPPDVIKHNENNAHYGHKVEFAGDINNDGFSDIIVSAVGQSNWRITAPDDGTAYVYYGGSSGLNHTPASTITSNKSLSTMGSGVAGADVNGDGYSDVIVGAQNYMNRYSNEGLVLVFFGSAGGARLASTATTTALSETTLTEKPSASVKAYPNPAINNLSVQFEGFNAGSNTYIQLLDAKGTLVQTIQAGAVENGNQPIDVSKLTPGLYFVIIQNGSKVFREKIIKQ
jgi:hypothetical protein